MVNIQDDSRIEPTETFALRLFPFIEEDPLLVLSPSVTLVSIADNDRKYNYIILYAGHIL